MKSGERFIYYRVLYFSDQKMVEEEGKEKGVAENPALGEKSALPFSSSDVAKAIRWRRPASIAKKTGFTLYWDAWHAHFVLSGRGERLAKDWYIIPLCHWTENQLDNATKDFISQNYDERFVAWLSKRIEEQGLEQKWAEDYANVMKKMPEWAPSLNKKADLL